MPDENLLTIGRWLGLVGLGLLVFSGIGGVLLASRTAQKLKFLKGRTFNYHRVLSLVGAALFLLHPVPMILAEGTSGMTIRNTFIPFTAPKQTLLIGLGTVAAYVLAVVTIFSIDFENLATRRDLRVPDLAVLGLAANLESLLPLALLLPSRIELDPRKFFLCGLKSRRRKLVDGDDLISLVTLAATEGENARPEKDARTPHETYLLGS